MNINKTSKNKTFTHNTSTQKSSSNKSSSNKTPSSKNDSSFNHKCFRQFNQYLYNNSINLTKDQKLLFVSSLLLCLKQDINFIKTFDLEGKNSSIVSQLVLKTIQNTFNDSCFTTQFQFIQQNIYNHHIVELMKKIQQYCLHYKGDVLKMFYSEFTQWDSINEGKIGVVLTPDDIVKIMVEQLELQPTDKVLDFCTGTGSFLIEVGKYTPYLYGCENNDQRYSMAKINFILNGFDYGKLKHSSCFNVPYECQFDKIIINPPFHLNSTDDQNPLNVLQWKSFTYEQRFMMYALELLKPGGIACFIVPRKNISKNKQNTKFKQSVLQNTSVKRIINLNSKVFSPNAMVETVIVVVQKVQQEEGIQNQSQQTQTQQINFIDDGYTIEKNVRRKHHSANYKTVPSKQFSLTPTNDWNYQEDIVKIDATQLYEQIFNKSLDLYKTHFINDLRSANNTQKDLTAFTFIPPQKIVIKDYTKYKLLDLFEIVKCKTFISKNTQEGNYPLISSSAMNNGVIKRIDQYTIDPVDGFDTITIARNGSVGVCFVHDYKFATTQDVVVLQSRKKLGKEKLCKKNLVKKEGSGNNMSDKQNTPDINILQIVITFTIQQRFNYNNKLTLSDLEQLELFVPNV